MLLLGRLSTVVRSGEKTHHQHHGKVQQKKTTTRTTTEMSTLYHALEPIKIPRKSRRFDSLEDHLACLEDSFTVYVGNLSFYTTETQVVALFSLCGRVRRVIMGLDRFQKTPCGSMISDDYFSPSLKVIS